MINLIKVIYKKGMLYLLLSVLFLLNACGIESDTFHRMPELLNRNTNFEKMEYSGPYTIFNVLIIKTSYFLRHRRVEKAYVK